MILSIDHYTSHFLIIKTSHSLHRIDCKKPLHKADSLFTDVFPITLRKGDFIDSKLIERQTGHLWREWVVTSEEEIGDDSE